MSRGGKIRTASGEIVIVVLGILIAFGLDAAWDNRTDRSRGRELLRSIEAELVANRSELERHVALRSPALRSTACCSTSGFIETCRCTSAT